MATEKLAFEFEVRDSASADLKHVEKGFRDVEKQMDKSAKSSKSMAKAGGTLKDSLGEIKTGALAAAAAVAGVTAFVKASVEAFVESERASTAYNFAMANLGASTETLAYAQQMMRANFERTGVAITEQEIALRELTIKLGDPAAAIAALGDAMDVAAATGGELADVAKDLGEVVTGEIGAFKSLGLITQEDEAKINLLTSASERAAAAMDIVRSKVGGATDALNQQVVQLDVARGQWDGLQAGIGNLALTAAGPMIGDLATVVTFATNLADSLERIESSGRWEWIDNITEAAGWLHPMTAAYRLTMRAIGEANEAMEQTKNLVGELAATPPIVIDVFGPDVPADYTEFGYRKKVEAEKEAARFAAAEKARAAAEKRRELERRDFIARNELAILSAKDDAQKAEAENVFTLQKIEQDLDAGRITRAEAETQRAKAEIALVEQHARIRVKTEEAAAAASELAWRDYVAETRTNIIGLTDAVAIAEAEMLLGLDQVRRDLETNSVTRAEAEMRRAQVMADFNRTLAEEKKRRDEENHARALERIEEEAAAFQAHVGQMRRMGQSISSAFSRGGGEASLALGGISGSLTDIAANYALADEKAKASGQAQAAAAAGGAQAIAAFAESQGASQRAVNALMAATATAQGFLNISYGNIPGSVAAFTSAAIYGANAIGGGGSSSAVAPQAAASQPGPSKQDDAYEGMYQAQLRALRDARDEGKQTVVYNFSGATFLDGNVASQRRVDRSLSRASRMTMGAQND